MKKIMLTASAAVLLGSASVYASEGKFFFRLLPGASFNFFDTEVEFNVPQGMTDTKKEENSKKEKDSIVKKKFKKDNSITSIIGLNIDAGYYINNQFRVAISLDLGLNDYYNIKKNDNLKISTTKTQEVGDHAKANDMGSFVKIATNILNSSTVVSGVARAVAKAVDDAKINKIKAEDKVKSEEASEKTIMNEIACAKIRRDLGNAITDFANSSKIVASSYLALIVGEYDIIDSSFCKVFIGGGPGVSLVNSYLESDLGKFNELKRLATKVDKIAKENGDDKSTAKIQAGQGSYVEEKDQNQQDLTFSGKVYLGISKQFTPIVHGEFVAGYAYKGTSDIIAKAVDDKWYVQGTDGKNKLTHHNVNFSIGVRIDI